MNPRRKAALTLWLVPTEGRDNDDSSHSVSVAIDEDGKRIPILEKQSPSMLSTSSDRVGVDPRRAQAAAGRGYRTNTAA